MDFLSQLVYPISLACVIPRVESTFFINIKNKHSGIVYIFIIKKLNCVK